MAEMRVEHLERDEPIEFELLGQPYAANTTLTDETLHDETVRNDLAHAIAHAHRIPTGLRAGQVRELKRALVGSNERLAVMKPLIRHLGDRRRSSDTDLQ